MKNLLIALSLILLPVVASAQTWNVHPTKGNPATAANQAAANVGVYVISVAGMEQGKPGLTRFTIGAAKRAVKAGMKTCYGPNTEFTQINVKPEAPVFCIEDVISYKSTVDASTAVKAYANKLSPVLTEETFQGKIDSILAE